MTSIKINEREIIYQDDVLQRKVERWVKQCRGKTERDIAKIFVILNMKFPIVLTEETELMTMDGALISCKTGSEEVVTIKIAPELLKVERQDKEKCATRIDIYKCDFEIGEIIKLQKSLYESQIISMESKLFDIGGYYLQVIINEEGVQYNCNIIPNNSFLIPKFKIERKDLESDIEDFFEKSEINFNKVESKLTQVIKEKLEGVCMMNLFETDVDGTLNKYKVIEF